MIVRILTAVCLATLAAPSQTPPAPGPVKATFANVIKLNAYADNWCIIYINGKLVAVDSIEFLPHNVVSVNILPTYPMTIAVLAKDNADPATGLEYGTQIGDAGFILKLADGTVTSSAWKAKSFFRGPLNRDIANPKVVHTPIPPNWFAPDFDDSAWPQATEYAESRVKPDGDYSSFDFSGARFIWTDDIDLDNTVIFRYTAPKPARWTKTWTADGDIDITNIVAEARLSLPTAPALFEVSPDRLATGYLTRVRGATQTAEQFVASVGGAASPVPIDLGPASDQLFLILYGAAPGTFPVSATIGGEPATVAYAGYLAPGNGVAQFNLAVPRSLAGRGSVDIVLTSAGKSSNPVRVVIQ